MWRSHEGRSPWLGRTLLWELWRNQREGQRLLAVVWGRNCKAVSQQIDRNCNRRGPLGPVPLVLLGVTDI